MARDAHLEARIVERDEVAVADAEQVVDRVLNVLGEIVDRTTLRADA